MQFSPNTRARYASALRIYLQKRIAKNGICNKTLSFFRNILLFEIICCEKTFTETQLDYFFDKLSLSILAEMIKRNRWVNIKVTGNGKGKINRSAVIFIVCQCIVAHDINIDIKDKFIKITTDNLNHSAVLTRVIKAIGGLLIKDIGKEKYGIFIPFFRCKNSVIKSPDEYEYLFNRLSTLRVFLSI